MSRAQKEAQFQRLTQVLCDAHGVDVWVARLQALADDEGPTLATALLRAYRHGALTPTRWTALTGHEPADDAEVGDTIRRFWDAAAAVNLARPHAIEGVGSNPRAIRRWAWQPRWHLMEQDEDLMLMDDRVMPALLEIAATRELPKRDYILEIVAHHARDSCTHAFYWNADIPRTLQRAAQWAPGARSAGAHALAEYLERLGRHAIAGPVDRATAVQRLRDVARCHEPTAEAVAVRAVDGGWEGDLLHSSGDRRVVIDAATGAVRFAASDPGPAGGRRSPR